MNRKATLWIVEDDDSLRDSLRSVLSRRNYAVVEAATLKAALAGVKSTAFDLMLLDLTLPDGNGISLLRHLPEHERNRVIVISGTPDLNLAIQAMKMGVFEFLVKPIDREMLLTAIRKALSVNRQLEGYRELQGSLRDFSSFDRIQFRSRSMKETIHRAREAAECERTILIQGETGTGKELLAYAIHNASPRRQHPIIPVNCAAIPEHLAESELFGFEQGAFTGASSSYSGRFRLAEKGTIFLDEIGEMPQSIQSKLLRVLESGEVSALKSRRMERLDVRVIAASNRDLQQMVDTGLFREDLFYRLEQIRLTIPPLRERPEDIRLLADSFLRSAALTYNREAARLSAAALDCLTMYHWPGNVRELKNTIFEIVTFLDGGEIQPGHLPAKIQDRSDSRSQAVKTLKEVEAEHVRGVLRQTGFNISRSADLLGISRPCLYRKIRAFNLKR
ncbi:MAG: sigma-54 dependent transcriptional regulator [Acidobacteriota bacterium]|jgi:DNA-binding NtrC family response regulator|nr:sigma-54 dependent transcriptional regulator [Acidobacteriota bacterium]